MAGRPRKVASDSPAEMVRRLTRPDGGIDPPPGIVLETDELRQIWEQFTRARTTWRDMDLILLAKAVRFEAKIRELERLIQREGMIIENFKGTPIKHPAIEIQDGYLRQMLAVIRSMSLGTDGTDARTLNGNGKLAAEESKTLKAMGGAKLLAV